MHTREKGAKSEIFDKSPPESPSLPAKAPLLDENEEEPQNDSGLVFLMPAEETGAKSETFAKSPPKLPSPPAKVQIDVAQDAKSAPGSPLSPTKSASPAQSEKDEFLALFKIKSIPFDAEDESPLDSSAPRTLVKAESAITPPGSPSPLEKLSSEAQDKNDTSPALFTIKFILFDAENESSLDSSADRMPTKAKSTTTPPMSPSPLPESELRSTAQSRKYPSLNFKANE
ncbi:hypothetical protein GYMLUDRAFT_243787 [Collybiopsis luxurians FD-317 M1]|uniref:Uncharacterized protein n=1 Tax=Collybiopsis luxurians FD-317 M1 TaxID=944289 RepID=A0A0D0CEV7_9AGAR|nr:hypothetical protein GYMLUDRAFT_243787 [Collybiopsis luxurians FD-317 M1]